MNPIEHFLSQAEAIEKKLGVHFANRDLLVLAFTHRSFINENRDIAKEHNERLEFLGDAVLNLLIAEHLYRDRPDVPEGELSKLRSHFVQSGTCAQYVDNLGVGDFVLMGNGERISSRGRESICADLFEAILGAIYLDQGLEAARKFLMKQHFEEISVPHNWKAELQDVIQKRMQKTPIYVVIEESGPDHAKHFVVEVCIDDQAIGKGEGPSKKEAQQAAAKDAMERL